MNYEEDFRLPNVDDSDEFQLDQAMELESGLMELGNQLSDDAAFLGSRFPAVVRRSDPFADFVSECVLAASEHRKERVDHVASEEVIEKVVSSKTPGRKNNNRMSRYGGGVIRNLGMVATAFLVLGLTLLPMLFSGPKLGRAVSNPSLSVEISGEPEVFVTPVSLNTIPENIRKASQPELEALYDAMHTESSFSAKF